jgi:2'-5' RNA ligase
MPRRPPDHFSVSGADFGDICSSFVLNFRVWSESENQWMERQMSGGQNVDFERQKLSSGSKLILLAQPGEDALDLIRRTARALRRRHGFTGRPLDDDRLHVSIAGFGPYAMIPFVQVNAMRHILSRLEFGEFDIYFDRAASFNGAFGYPLALYGDNANQPLIDLEKSVRKLLEPHFGKPGRSSYHPHMTLLYDRRKIAAEWIESPIRWRARELALVESRPGRAGYHSICTFSCGEPRKAARWRPASRRAFGSGVAVPW